MQVSFGGEIRLGEFSLIGYFFFAPDDVSTRVKLNEFTVLGAIFKLQF